MLSFLCYLIIAQRDAPIQVDDPCTLYSFMYKAYDTAQPEQVLHSEKLIAGWGTNSPDLQRTHKQY